MLGEQKSCWNYSKGWDKGSRTSLLEEPAGQQCGWVSSQLLALPSPGTWESIMTLLTFYQPSSSLNLNLIRAKQNGETLWHHQLLAEEWISENESEAPTVLSPIPLCVIWASDGLFHLSSCTFVFHLIRNLNSSHENGMFCTAQVCDWKHSLSFPGVRCLMPFILMVGFSSSVATKRKYQ